ncbi:unnamed protein product [Camellia sinensis]
MRFIRNVTDSKICPRCQTTREDMHHLLRDCPKAKAAWLNLKGITWWQQSNTILLTDWITKNLRCKAHLHNIQWPTVFLITLWLIWKEMNKEVFENHTKLPHISAKLILTQARETQDAFKAILNPHYKDPQLMFWSCPIAGKLKLNTDGSSKGDPGQAGYGGLLRDEAGTWVWGFYGYLGSCTSLEAELWSIYRGLTIIIQKGLASIQIETDSKQVMELI